MLPGAGGTLATFMAYAVEKKVSRHPERFGTGAVEGLAAPEAANNAAAGGSMVPLLALGIPGPQPPRLCSQRSNSMVCNRGRCCSPNSQNLVWALIASLYVANVLLVALNLPLAGLWAKLLRVPPGLLYGAVVMFSVLGAFSLKGSIGDVVIIWVLGALAFVLRRFSVPVAAGTPGSRTGPTAGAGIPPGNDRIRRGPDDFCYPADLGHTACNRFCLAGRIIPFSRRGLLQARSGLVAEDD